jgi:hypothetical protein
MRQTISGLVAAIAVMAASAAPAMACGGGLFVSPCEQAYVPVPTYTPCYSGCWGWARERLPDPEQQYYYVNQGPTYTGPGDFAPYPTYQEGAVSGRASYRHRPYYYGYDGGRYADAVNHRYDGAPNVDGPAIYSYRAHPHFRPWRRHSGYRYSERPSVRYGYAARHSYAPRYSLPPRRFYAHHSMRYGARVGMPYRYGNREHMMHRYN